MIRCRSIKSDTDTLKDRLVFFLAVNTGFLKEGVPDDRFLEFYRIRSSPELHCAIVGNVVVPDGFGSNLMTPTLSSDPIWTDLANAIEIGGSLPGIQLATVWEGYVGTKRFVSHEPQTLIAQGRQLVERMGFDAVSSILNSFDLAADLATRHGFCHVQFHAAHGYLLSLLIDNRINSNAAYVLERLATLSERLKSRGVQTSIRVSMRTGDADFDSLGAPEFLDSVAALPFDFVDLSSGFYNIDKRLIYPARPDFLEARLQESVSVGLRHPGRSFIVSGRASIHDWTDIPANMHLGLCRDLIANPKFLQELDNGCRNHSKCHYYSRGEDNISCGRWSSD